MSTLSQFGFGGGRIKSIQRLSVTHPVNSPWPSSVTINAVDTSKTIVLTSVALGYSTLGSDAVSNISSATATLSSSTSLSIYGQVEISAFGIQSFAPLLNIQVVEFY